MISLHNKIQNNHSKHIRFNNRLSFSPLIITNQYPSDFNVNCSSNLIINNIVHLDTIFHLLHHYNKSLWNKQNLNKNFKHYSIISKIFNLNNPLYKNLLHDTSEEPHCKRCDEPFTEDENIVCVKNDIYHPTCFVIEVGQCPSIVDRHNIAKLIVSNNGLNTDSGM
ncbi:unnamed protein product [Schistosoma curassoni]|uniref:Kazal-like domain-containing protein n=1 Tax=Schistosoma curassoni TaxID=6186 RepID=A0A183KAH2_9TREM|nr:unnamed protein product [Schistosoma curassoni]